MLSLLQLENVGDRSLLHGRGVGLHVEFGLHGGVAGGIPETRVRDGGSSPTRDGLDDLTVLVDLDLNDDLTLQLGVVYRLGPNYVEVLNYNTGFSEIVRYDPEKHNLNNILGGARLYHGISQTIFRPGFYAKTGLVFDLAKNDYKLTALEIGLQIQMVFPFIKQMAFNPAKKFYLTGYLSFNFGKKIGRQR